VVNAMSTRDRAFLGKQLTNSSDFEYKAGQIIFHICVLWN